MSSTRHKAQIAFLREIKKQVPDVLSSLAQNVLPIYQKLSLIRKSPPYYGLYEYWGLNPGMLSTKARFFEEYPVCEESPIRYIFPETEETKLVSELIDAICRWASEWQLVDEWLLSEVLQTMMKWRSSSVNKDWAYSPEKIGGYDYDLIFSFEYKPWDMEANTWTFYRNEIYKDFEKSLLSYKKKAEKKAKEIGYYVAKREKDEKSHHFAWVVDFQIKKKEIKDIVSSYQGSMGINSSSVHEAIQSTAALLDLTLRPAKRGRPKSK